MVEKYGTTGDLVKITKIPRATIFDYVRKKIIPAEKTENGRYVIDLKQAIDAIEKYKNRNKKPLKSEGKKELIPPVADSNRVSAYYKSKIEQHKYEVVAGNFVNKHDVEIQVFAAFRTLRDNLNATIPQVSALLAAETDQIECERILKRKQDGVFTAFQNWKFQAKER